MSKDAIDTANMPEETPATQTSLDLFNSFLNAPVTKLDADEYTANDLDGVTETLLGSGNMNFLMMQAGQTNESMSNANPFNIQTGDTAFGASPLFSPNAGTRFDGAGTASDRAFGSAEGLGGGGDIGPLNNTNATAGSLSASNSAANSAATNPFTDTSAFSSASLVSTGSSTPSQNGQGGNDGVNGTNGTPGDGGTTIINNTVIDNSVTNGDTITNIFDGTIIENVENIYNDTTNLLTEITNNAGDVVTTIVNNAGNIVTNITDNTSTVVQTVVNNTTEIVTNITDSTTTILQTIVDDTTSIVNNVVNNVFAGNPLTLGPVGLSLDATIDNLTNLNLDIISGGNIINVLNETLDTAPILAPVGGIVGDLLSSTSLDVILNPFQYDSSPNDFDLHLGTDLNLLNIPLPPLALDIPLDPVEALLGDIDIGLDLTDDLLDLGSLLGGGANDDTDLSIAGLEPVTDILETLVNPVEDLAGDIDIGGALGVDLLGIGGGDTGPDTDITIPLDIDLLDSDIFSDVLAVSLDPIETITGDIDLDLGVATDLLGAIADPLFDNQPGGSGAATPLAMLGDALSGLADGLIPLNDSADTDLSLNTGVDLLDQGLLSNGGVLTFDPVEDLAGNIDIGGAIGLDLLGIGGGDTGPDTDITIPLDLDVLDNNILSDTLAVSLDPVETITGDIDLDLGVATDLLGASADPLINNQPGGGSAGAPLAMLGDALSGLAGGLIPLNDSADSDLALTTGVDLLDQGLLSNGGVLTFDPVENLIGDLDIGAGIGLDLLGTNNEAGTDTDIAIPLDIDFIDSGFITDTLAVSLDPVETLTGDIDIDLGIAGNLLGNVAGDMFDAAAGGTGGDDILTQLGDGASCLVDGLLPFDDVAADGDITLINTLGLNNTDLLSNTAEITIDPVENLLGDIDIVSDLAIDIMDGLTGSHAPDIEDLNIGFEDIGNLVPDTLGLDAAESLVGDIDWNNDISGDTLAGLGGLLDILDTTIDTAVSLIETMPLPSGGLDLGGLSGGLPDGLGSVSSWTETVLPDAGSALGGGLAAGVLDTLPDPVAVVTNVLPLPAPVLPVLGGGLFGGHGGGHHGGLFG